jgi:hypothetical protein
MANLEIDYHIYSVFTVDEDTSLFLDREFLSRGEDLAVSRAPDAPCLRHRAGSWWIDNDSDRNEATVILWAAEGKHEIPRQCSFALPDGEVELFPWDGERYKVALAVSGSDLDQTRPGSGRSRRPEPITLVGLEDADPRVQELFKQKPRTRTILAALYREYLTRGSSVPRPLSRDEVRQCMGFTTPAPVDSALQEVQRAIWGESGHADEVPGFLINRGHLKLEHQMVIPHRECVGHNLTGREHL